MRSVYGTYDRRDWPFWKRVSPWWASLLLSVSCVLRLFAGFLPAWAIAGNVVVAVFGVVIAAIDIRRLRAFKRARALEGAAEA